MPRPVDNPPSPWSSTHVEYLGEAPPAKLEVFEERARSVLARNESPDVPFRYSVNPYRGCIHACAYCLEGSTPVLMADGGMRSIDSLRVGDEVYGTELRGRYRRYVRTTILDHWRTEKPAYRIRLADGTEIVASGDHRFLTERGWKHVAPREDSGQRPFLTTNNSLVGPGRFPTAPRKDDEYRRGYLCGMIRGDGLIGFYDYARTTRGGTRQFQFRLALVDLEALFRARDYLREFDIETREFEFAHAANDRAPMRAIRTHARSAVVRIDDLIAWPTHATDEWCRGFLAGIFDAEGSYSRGILRISNADQTIVDRTCECAVRLGFDPVVERHSRAADVPRRADIMNVRIRGGLPAHLKFFLATDPAITRKRDFTGQAVKHTLKLDVVAVEPLGVAVPMYDVTTGTGDFIANGVVSHNCYARPSHQYLGFGAGTDFDRKIVAKVNAPEVLRKEFMRPSWQGECITFSGNTDCYQALEANYQLTRRCLEVCLEFRNPVAIITKSALVRRDVELIAALAREADAGVYVSIAFADDATARKIEPYAAAVSQRFEILRALSAAGVRVGVSLAPLIPGLNDSDVPEILRRAADAGAKSAFFTLLRLAPETAAVFDERIAEAFPTRARKVNNGLVELRAGNRGDLRFGARMKGEGTRWEASRALFDLWCKKLGLNAEESHVSRPNTFRRPTRQGELFPR